MAELAPRRYQLLVFDWDGTLADSTGIIVDAIRRACADAGIAVPTAEAARQVIGLGLPDVLALIAPGITPDARKQLVDSYRDYYFSHDDDIALYEGVPALLADLDAAGYRLAVATGKSRAGLERAMRLSGLGGRFDATRCADEGQPKPHPGMLIHLMQALDSAPSSTLMIGDTTHDLDLAANARVDALAMSHGAHDRTTLATRAPRGIVHSCAELREWLAAEG